MLMIIIEAKKMYTPYPISANTANTNQRHFDARGRRGHTVRSRDGNAKVPEPVGGGSEGLSDGTDLWERENVGSGRFERWECARRTLPGKTSAQTTQGVPCEETIELEGIEKGEGDARSRRRSRLGEERGSASVLTRVPRRSRLTDGPDVN